MNRGDRHTTVLVYATMTVTALALMLFALVANAQTWTYKPSPCYPTSYDQLLWRSENNVIVVVWYCELPNVIFRNNRAFSIKGQIKTIPSATQKSAQVLDSTYINRAMTAEETLISTQLHTELGPKITVAANGDATTRPIYAATATHTRGAVTSARAAVGAPCGFVRLVTIEGKATNYHAVPGGYTVCKITSQVKIAK